MIYNEKTSSFSKILFLLRFHLLLDERIFLEYKSKPFQKGAIKFSYLSVDKKTTKFLSVTV